MNKIMKMHALKAILISAGLLTLAGCMSTKTIPHGDMTMAQIYKEKTGLAIPEDGGRKTEDGQKQKTEEKIPQVQALNATAVDYTSISQNQINSQFKPLPNPSIAVYVFPHLSHFGRTDVPIPGYTTAFFLYEANAYAMPSEIY